MDCLGGPFSAFTCILIRKRKKYTEWKTHRGGGPKDAMETQITVMWPPAREHLQSAEAEISRKWNFPESLWRKYSMLTL